MKYRYAIAITGVVEAKDEDQAKLLVLMGTSITTRLAQSPHEVSVRVAELNSVEPQHTDKKGIKKWLLGVVGL